MRAAAVAASASADSAAFGRTEEREVCKSIGMAEGPSKANRTEPNRSEPKQTSTDHLRRPWVQTLLLHSKAQRECVYALPSLACTSFRRP